MHFYLAISIFWIASYGLAQNVSHASFDNYALRYNNDELPNDNFIGSPFLYEDWRRAEIVIQTDTIQYNQARFNINRNIMEVKVQGEHLYVHGAQISQFRWRGDEEESKSIYRPNIALVKSNPKTKELLRTTILDNLKILSSYWVVVRTPSSETPNLGGSINEGRIIVQRRHFIMKEDELYPIKKTNDLCRVLNIVEKKAKKIIKSESLNMDKHSDLVHLILKLKV